MALEGDVMLRFREDACFAIYSLIADALFRCTTQCGATRMIVKICSLPPSVPSLPPMYLFSVAHSGPDIKTLELRNFFLRFSKSCYSTSSPQLGLRWGGVVRVLTADSCYARLFQGNRKLLKLFKLSGRRYRGWSLNAKR
ncbi:hypothetical protein M758_3G188300 [Ceratodon purpureus]|nr:hypothetical protein M758_3G188300 [Ceratodon purpureus]